MKYVLLAAVLAGLVLGIGATTWLAKPGNTGQDNQSSSVGNDEGGVDMQSSLLSDGNHEASLAATTSVMPAAQSGSPSGIFYTTQQLANKVEAIGREPRIAYVDYTFTEAAYSADQFYQFYRDHVKVPADTPIRDNLTMLTAPVRAAGLEFGDHGEAKYFKNLALSKYPAHISIIGDLEVHNGAIFSSSGKNSYDALILGHNEYMTQKEYSNLKKFVTINGGSIILMDGNTFMVEVSYNSSTNTISYLHGHGFQYFQSQGYAIRDGQPNDIISPGHISNEWWLTENSQWLGSNYIETSPSIKIVNNVFSVPPWEDNAVTNSAAVVLIDYKTFGTGFNPANPLVTKSYPIDAFLYNSGSGKIFAYGVFTSKNYSTTNWLEFLNYCIYHSF